MTGSFYCPIESLGLRETSLLSWWSLFVTEYLSCAIEGYVPNNFSTSWGDIMTWMSCRELLFHVVSPLFYWRSFFVHVLQPSMTHSLSLCDRICWWVNDEATKRCGKTRRCLQGFLWAQLLEDGLLPSPSVSNEKETLKNKTDETWQEKRSGVETDDVALTSSHFLLNCLFFVNDLPSSLCRRFSFPRLTFNEVMPFSVTRVLHEFLHFDLTCRCSLTMFSYHAQTYVGPILLSTNPFKKLPFYTPSIISLYQQHHNVFDLPPHV